MKNVTKKIHWLSGFVAVLFSMQLQAATVMTGSATFAETNGLWSGTLFAEVSGTVGNYTSTFNLVMDANTDATSSVIRDITFSSWQLGAGTSAGATSGGSTGGDPSLALVGGFFGNDARFDFSGLAEGTSSASFWFDFADLDLTGDSIAMGLSDFSNNVASPFTLNLTAVPLPAAVWLFGTGLIGLAGLARQKRTK